MTNTFANCRMKVYSTIGECYLERENENMKRLPDSELEIMMIIWEFNRPVTRFEIEAEMGEERTITSTTLLTFLARLQEKGFLAVEKMGKNNLYSPLVEQEVYMQKESKNILKRLYRNSARNFLAALYDGNNLSQDDLKELEEYIRMKREEE